ncbi:MAG: sugar transferase [Mucilaginibacter sp.]|nr:sugar transferase [Mucilaginibacter sp.]
MLYSLTKRIIDLILSFVLIVILLPLLILVSLFVYIDDPGPILYIAIRMGKGQTPFKLWKFRSMKVNSLDIRNVDGSTFNSESDPRVTRIGRFIRKTSIDELPQLFNVLAASMSFVGPRPDPFDAIKFYREKDFLRLSVMPGITGWAQVNGRNGIKWDRRRDLDLEYVKKRSFYLDILIMLKTLFVVFKRSNIHLSEE